MDAAIAFVFIIAIVPTLLLCLCHCLYKKSINGEDDDIQPQPVSWPAIMAGDHDRVAALCSGADPRVLVLMPVLVYENKDAAVATGMEEGECVICLSNLEHKDEFRVLPGCSHRFHRHCIDPWLRANTTCPVCRADLNLRYIGAMV